MTEQPVRGERAERAAGAIPEPGELEQLIDVLAETLAAGTLGDGAARGICRRIYRLGRYDGYTACVHDMQEKGIVP